MAERQPSNRVRTTLDEQHVEDSLGAVFRRDRPTLTIERNGVRTPCRPRAAVRGHDQGAEPRPVAVAFELDEAPRYQLSYGGRWESDLGLGGVIDLVNRNTLGRGHRTGVRGILNQEERSIRLYHVIPTPLRSERSSLELFVEAKREFIEDVDLGRRV